MSSANAPGIAPLATSRASYTYLSSDLTSGPASGPASPSHFPRSLTTSPSPPPVTQSSTKLLHRTLDTLRNARHFLLPAPEELSDIVLENAAYDPDRIQVTSSWGSYSPRSRYDPPEPSYVRVRLFQQIGDDIQETHLFDDVPICHNGKLNLSPTMSRWNLQNMTVVDTDWTQFVDLTEPFTLSPSTLESMINEYQRIYILERPSFGRACIRQLRRRLMGKARRLGQVWRDAAPLDNLASIDYNRGTTVVIEPVAPTAPSLCSWPSETFSCGELFL